MRALSVAAAIQPEFDRPAVRGVGLGQGYVDFERYVLALTAPGAPRMPNGIETSLRVSSSQFVWLGDGSLRSEAGNLEPGPVWNAVPDVRYIPAGGPHLKPDPEGLAGRGSGLTPAGDDVLAGYAAGLTLFHGLADEAAAIASRAGPLTTRLSATLLECAARGELPEPAHAYLERGDDGPLDRFGHSSGRCLKLGLMLAAAGPGGRLADADEVLALAREPSGR